MDPVPFCLIWGPATHEKANLIRPQICPAHGEHLKDCKRKKTAAVEETIKDIEAATDMLDLCSIAPLPPKVN